MQLEQDKKLKKFAELVFEKNKVHNLTAAKTAEDFYNKHIKDCLCAFKKIKPKLSENIVDCGSGAGLPGMVWAVLSPNSKIWSVDSNQKKIAFQKYAKRELGLKNIEPIAIRIQDHMLPEGSSVVFKAFSSIGAGAESLRRETCIKNLLFFKKDDEKTAQEITEATSLLYDYKRHEYLSNKEKMLIVELYDNKNSNN